MKNIPLLIGTILGTLLLIVGVAFFFSGTQPSQTAENQVVDMALLTDGARHVLGAENPTVTIVEFSDFSCPSCRSVAPLVKQVVNQHPDDVALIYRHFPLGSFPHSQYAAQASEVAAEYDLFWEMTELLYARQDEWARLSSDTDAQQVIDSYAEELGIDMDEFTEKIQSNEYRDFVFADRSVGNALNITGTPTLFVNGQRLSAPNQLPELVEALLAASPDSADESPDLDDSDAEENEREDN